MLPVVSGPAVAHKGWQLLFASRARGRAAACRPISSKPASVLHKRRGAHSPTRLGRPSRRRPCGNPLRPRPRVAAASAAPDPGILR
jgi:hypothetical protein